MPTSPKSLPPSRPLACKFIGGPYDGRLILVPEDLHNPSLYVTITDYFDGEYIYQQTEPFLLTYLGYFRTT